VTTRLHDVRRYELDADRLVALYKDPEFQLARSRALGTLEATCEREGDVVVLEETRDTGFKPHLYVTRLTTRWDGRRATWELTRVSGPGDAAAEGTLLVEPRGKGSTLTLEGTLEVRVPLLGRMIERLARRGLTAEKDVEAKFVERWIRTISTT